MYKIFVPIIAIAGFILFLFFAIFGKSIMEARTFNKFTDGKKATMIDALFAELRVEACK